jgi:hypothetical protein
LPRSRSKHSNQNQKPDLGQESEAHDRDRKEHVARRERVHECLASYEAREQIIQAGKCFGSKRRRREMQAAPASGAAQGEVRLGQSRRFSGWPTTSDTPRLADILRASRHVSKVPEADIRKRLAYSRDFSKPLLMRRCGSGVFDVRYTFNSGAKSNVAGYPSWL